MIDIIKPDWPAPENIRAFTTTRLGGYSEAPYDSMNLALHVGDEEEDVLTNRSILAETLDIPAEPIWLNQVHGTRVICADCPPADLDADASFAKLAQKVCVVMTADCLPILITDTKASIVAAIHAGWRSLADGIIAETLKAMHKPTDTLLAWLGPTICQQHYEIGEEVYKKFIRLDPQHQQAFKPSKPNHWFCDLYAIARLELQKLGVTQIYGGKYCTYKGAELFYSARRDGFHTGRMASIIWINPVE